MTDNLDTILEDLEEEVYNLINTAYEDGHHNAKFDNDKPYLAGRSAQFKLYAKQAIEAYIAERETQARIDELNALEKALDDPKYSYPGEDGWDYDMYKYLEDRENQLKSNERVKDE